MIKLDISAKKLRKVINKRHHIEEFGGICVALSDKYVLKFNYKDFIKCFDKNEEVSTDFYDLGDISAEVARLAKLQKDFPEINIKQEHTKKLIAQSKNVKGFTLMQGIAYCQGYPIGYILKNNKNLKSLLEVMHTTSENLESKDCERIGLQIWKKIYKATEECLRNNIMYSGDFSLSDILYDTKTKEIQFRDCDEVFAYSTEADDIDEKFNILEKNIADLKKLKAAIMAFVKEPTSKETIEDGNVVVIDTQSAKSETEVAADTLKEMEKEFAVMQQSDDEYTEDTYIAEEQENIDSLSDEEHAL